MKLKIQVLSGSRAGAVFVFSKIEITVGRHPKSDLQFDPEADRGVSARHAVIVRQGDRWVVRDAGSRSGTWVNGHRAEHETALGDTDQVQFGEDGPKTEIRLVPDTETDVSPRLPQTGVMRPSLPAGHTPPKASTTQRVRVEVQKQTRHHRRVSMALVALLVVTVGAFVAITRIQKAAQEEQIQRIQAQVDSVLDEAEQSMAQLEGRMAGLAQALTTSQQMVRSLNTQMASARNEGNDEQIAVLSEELNSALTALAERQLAAGVNFRAIAQENQPAVAMLFAEFRPGQVETATAFAITPDGIMVTNRHAVAGPTGDRPALRLGVRFDGSHQTFRARTIAVSDNPDIDLALIKVELAGNVPVVGGINSRPDSVAVGSPVAVLGFPGGMDSPQRETEEGVYATASLTAGTVSKNLPAVLQVNGYGSPGASGSPVFDANGRVIAVIFGGEGAAGGRLLYAVPAQFITELMERVN